MRYTNWLPYCHEEKISFFDSYTIRTFLSSGNRWIIFHSSAADVESAN